VRPGKLALAIGAPVTIGLLAAPLAWIALASLGPDAGVFAGGTGVADLSLANYRALVADRGFLLAVRNSLVVAGLTTAIALPLAACCAYALARLPFRGRGPLLALLLAVSMFPQISVVAPLFLVLRELHLINTYPGLVLPYVTFTTPLAVWLLTGLIRQLPREVEEAALMDGASRLRAMRDVVLPLAAPALASTAILTFLYAWNEFLFALSFTFDADRQTVPVAVALLRGRYQVPWGQVLAAAVLASLPVACVVAAFERRIVAGLTAGAVKG